jgi:hypothetical protein
MQTFLELNTTASDCLDRTMTNSSNSPANVPPKVAPKKAKVKKGEDKISAEALSVRLNKILTALPERASKWLESSDPVEAEKLVTLLYSVASFLKADSEESRKKYPSVDRTVELFQQSYQQSPEVRSSDEPAVALDSLGGLAVSSTVPTPDQTSPGDAVPASPPGDKQTLSSELPAQSDPQGPKTAGPKDVFEELRRIVTGVNTLQVEQKKLLSAAESTKKSVQPIEQLSAEVRKSGDTLLAMRTTLNTLATDDHVRSAFSALLEISRRTQADLQNIQMKCTQLAEAIESQKPLLRSATDGVERLNGKIDAKIDLRDADDVLKLRDELEPHVHASIIRSVSTEVMVAVEHLKRKIPQQDAELTEAVADLESGCLRAGLIPIDKLF